MVVMAILKQTLPFVLSVLAVAAQLPTRFVGTVESFKVDAAEIAVRPDQGATRLIRIIPESVVQRVAPGEKDLKNARPISITDVAIGDRVLVALEPGANDLRRLVVMPASEIVKRDELDRKDWQERGVSGVVAARNEEVITLRVRSMLNETETRLRISAKTVFRRYAPDSVKFTDARASSVAELSLGDQVRARGQKTSDGSVEAEDVVFGSFVTKAGKITAVDSGSHSITIAELGGNKAVVIRFSPDSQIKKMPGFPEMGAGMPGGGMQGAGRPPDMAQMLERMPSALFDELRAGDTIVASSTKQPADQPLTAIMLLTNAELLIRMLSMQKRGKPDAAGGAQPAMGAGMGGAGMAMGGIEGLQLPGIMQ